MKSKIYEESMNICKFCGKKFIKSKGCIQFCSIKCKNSNNFKKSWEKYRNKEIEIWNKGKTAINNESIAKYANKQKGVKRPQTSKTLLQNGKLKGKIPWNKGKKNPGASKNFWTKGRNSHFSLTKPHRKIKNFLIENNLYENFISESYLKANNKCYHPDEINKKRKLIIEIFGDIWHCNPSKYKNENEFISLINKTVKEVWDYDFNKIKNYKKEGYKTLIIWENDINNNFDFVKEKIKEFLKEEKIEK